MKTEKQGPPAAAQFRESDLFQLELLIAKRADRLWRMAGGGPGRDLLHWLQAEAEVFERFFGADRVAEDAMACERR